MSAILPAAQKDWDGCDCGHTLRRAAYVDAAGERLRQRSPPLPILCAGVAGCEGGAGGLDEMLDQVASELFPNEETELVSHLARHGYTTMVDPDLIVRRAHRRSLAGLVCQFFGYGRGRMRQMQRADRGSIMPFLAPPLGLVYLALLPILAWLWDPGPRCHWRFT